MSSEAHIIKSGNVLLKTGGLMASKKKKWCVMFTQGDRQPWLDFHDNQEQAQKENNKHKKTYQLNTVKSIDKIIKMSSKDFYIDIHLKKGSISLFYDNENDVESWNNALQIFVQIVGGDGSSHSQLDVEEDDGSTFRPNVLYDSSADTISFDVDILETDLTRKHHLSLDKKYKIHVTMTCLSLECDGSILYRWQYDHIRSYGSHKSKRSFNMDMGRRSVTGEGEFEFSLTNPTRITQAIDLQTARRYNQKQKAQLLQNSGAESHGQRGQSLSSSANIQNPEYGTVGGEKRLSQKGKDPEFQRQLSGLLDVDKHKKNKKESKKEEKKSTWFGGNKKKDKKESKDQVKVEDERSSTETGNEEDLQGDDHIYDEAVPAATRPPLHAPRQKTTPEKPAIPKKPAQFRNSVEDEENLYNVIPSKGAPKQNVQISNESEYGIASGRPLYLDEEEEDPYDDTAQEVEYDDATSTSFKVKENTNNPMSAYELVD